MCSTISDIEERQPSFVCQVLPANKMEAHATLRSYIAFSLHCYKWVGNMCPYSVLHYTGSKNLILFTRKTPLEVLPPGTYWGEIQGDQEI
jgi:hypothetical protein